MRDQITRSLGRPSDRAAQGARRHGGRQADAAGESPRSASRCSRSAARRRSTTENTPGRRKARESMMVERFEQQSKKYLAEVASQRDDRVQIGRMSMPPLALTLGEPAGIGPDITFAAWRRRAELGLPPFYVLGRPAVSARAAPSASASACRSRSSNRRTPPPPSRTALPVVDLGLAVTAEPGQPDASSAPAAIAAIRRAVADVHGRRGRARSSPIRSPRTCSTARASPSPATPNISPSSPRNTTGVPAHPVMMLWSPELAVVPVTIHLPLRDVPAAAHHRPDRRDRPDRRARPARRASASPSRGSRSPASTRMPARTARSATRTSPSSRPPSRGCAPTASTRAARCRPTPCSTPRARATYDAALCMYHDQALIPIKTLAFDHAVNVTLGLPFVRTSPDHGTAFDIAGTGKRRSGEPDRRAACSPRASPRSPSRLLSRAAHERDRRPAAAARRHPPARSRRQEIARPELPARSQPDRAASPAPPGRSTASTVIEIGPGPGGLTRALLADGARRVDRHRARRPRHRRAGRDRRALSRPPRRRRRRRARRSIRARISPAARRASSPTCPTTSPPRCWSAGSPPSRGRPGTTGWC